MKYHLTMKSGNAKTGPIPVSTSSRETCPRTCPLHKRGCYANGGPLAIHWRKVTDGTRGVSYREFLKQVESIPNGQLWRHNQAGDLPGKSAHDTRIDSRKLFDLAESNGSSRGFTYTHKTARVNWTILRKVNASGFTVNLSANNVAEAKMLYLESGCPVVTILPADYQSAPKVRGDRSPILVCPAQVRDDITCESCGLCAMAKRKVIIGFLAHGSQKNAIEF